MVAVVFFDFAFLSLSGPLVTVFSKGLKQYRDKQKCWSVPRRQK